MGRMKISSKLILGIVVLLLLVSTLIGALSYKQAYDAVHSQVESNIPQMSVSGAKIVKSKLDYFIVAIEGVAGRNVIRSMEWEEKQRGALEFETKRLSFLGMAVISPDGNAKYPDGSTASLGDRSYFKDALSGKTVFSDVLISKVTNTAVMILATPIKGAAGNIVGVLIARLDANWLSAVTDDIKYGEKGYSYIVDSRGTLIAHANRKFVMEQKNFIEESKSKPEFLPVAKMLNKMIKAESGYEAYSFLGSDRFFAYNPIPGTDWSIAVGAQKDDVFSEVTAIRSSIIFVTLILLIIGILLGVLFAHKVIVKPIDNVVHVIKNLSENIFNGKLDTRANLTEVSVDFEPILEGTNELINTFIAPINVMSEYVDRIAKGNIPPKITENYRGDFVEVKTNLNSCIDIMNALIRETDTLTKGIENGALDIRSDSTRFMGSWGELITSINTLINTFIAPINTMAEYVEKISRGEIPNKITEEYKGDFKEVRENLNGSIDALNGLLESKKVLAKMAVNDFTDEVKGSYLGVYEDVKVSVNEVANRLKHVQNIVVNIANGDTGDLDKLKSDGKRSEKDNLVPSFIMMLESLTSLINGTKEYVDYSAKGEIESISLDEKSMKGVYKDVFKGLNKSAKVIVEPLLEILSVLQRMEKGDFTGEIKGNYAGGFLMLKNAVNNSISSINQLLTEVSKTTEQVSNGSQQVSNAAQVLSQGATTQASSIEEISSSMQEIVGQTSKNAENAVEANGLAIETSSVAEKGNTQMNNLLNAMSEIQKSSNDISKIIKVIDEIAFQTNLLALNAAVEAARAGVHGKGFAVVAEEVRNLAARSAKAAKETSEMIENAVQKSNAGSKMSKDTAEILGRIVLNIAKVSDIVAEIAAASNEQAQGASQINIGLSQVEQVTQSNTASAEESAAASEELSSQAAYLESMLKKFVLKDSGMRSKSNAPSNSNMNLRKSAAIDHKSSKISKSSPEDIISLDDDYFGKY